MHFPLLYDVVPDYVERRIAYREQHLRLAQAACDRGELVVGAAAAKPNPAVPATEARSAPPG